MCSYAAALVYTIQHYKRLGLNEVPAELPCTSLPQQWQRPRGSKIEPQPLFSKVFSKAQTNSKEEETSLCRETKSNVNAYVSHHQ